MADKLDARERRFVEQYLIDLDPKRAAIAAGYSASMAASKAYQWVSNGKVKPHVYAAVQRAQAKRSERTEITQDRVLKEFAKIGFGDIRSLFTPDGTLKPLASLTPDESAILSSVEVVTRTLPRSGDEPPEVEYVHKVRAWDKIAALVNIGKHLGMFVDRSDVNLHGKLTLEELVAQAANPKKED